MSLTTLLARSLAYGARFGIAAENLGYGNAFRIFRSIRSGSSLRSVYPPRLKREVFYRSAADRGVIAHFFYPQTRIVDTANHRVQIIVDAGANIGIETIRMRHFHPRARILAIEPDPDNFSVLLKNIHDDSQAEGLCRGVWSSDTHLRVLPGETNEAFSVQPVAPGEQADLEAVTMNTILERVGGEIDILKMDIEGAEHEVFSRNTEWVNHVKTFIFECPDYDYPGAAQQVFRSLAHLPLDTFVSGENIVLIRRDTGWKVETTPYL